MVWACVLRACRCVHTFVYESESERNQFHAQCTRIEVLKLHSFHTLSGYIINVSAMEGMFYRHKTPFHVHTNMAKAAVNMMTRTSAGELQQRGIYMNSVDTGWINDEVSAAECERVEVLWGADCLCVSFSWLFDGAGASTVVEIVVVVVLVVVVVIFVAVVIVVAVVFVVVVVVILIVVAATAFALVAVFQYAASSSCVFASFCKVCQGSAWFHIDSLSRFLSLTLYFSPKEPSRASGADSSETQLPNTFGRSRRRRESARPRFHGFQ